MNKEIVVAINSNYSETKGNIYKTDTLPTWVKGHSLEAYWKNYGIGINYRLATQREIEAYNQGIRNINNIPKVTREELINNKIAIECHTVEQAREVIKFLWSDLYESQKWFTFLFNFPHNINRVEFVYSSKSYITWNDKPYLVASGHANSIINYSEVDFEPKFVLPEKWVVKSKTQEQDIVIVKYFNKQHFIYSFYWNPNNNGYYYHFPYSQNNNTRFLSEGYTEITFEQFEKYVLNKKEETKETIKEQPKPDIEILGEKVEFIKKSIQFGDVTLTLKDLEAIKKVQKICEEQDINLEFSGDTIYIDSESSEGSQQSLTSKIDTIIKELNG